jgi:hypothetical protein
MNTMSIKVQWYIPGRIPYTTYNGQATIEEIEHAYSYMGQLIDQEGHPPYVHAVHDAVQLLSIPVHLVKLQAAIRPLLSHPQFGWGVIISENDYFKFAGVVISQVARTRVRYVGTHEQAIRFVQGVDQTLPVIPTAPPVNQGVMLFET